MLFCFVRKFIVMEKDFCDNVTILSHCCHFLLRADKNDGLMSLAEYVAFSFASLSYMQMQKGHHFFFKFHLEDEY